MSWGLGAGKHFSTDNSDLAALVAEENGETLAQVRVARWVKNNQIPLERVPEFITHWFDL